MNCCPNVESVYTAVYHTVNGNFYSIDNFKPKTVVAEEVMSHIGPIG